MSVTREVLLYGADGFGRKDGAALCTGCGAVTDNLHGFTAAHGMAARARRGRGGEAWHLRVGLRADRRLCGKLLRVPRFGTANAFCGSMHADFLGGDPASGLPGSGLLCPAAGPAAVITISNQCAVRHACKRRERKQTQIPASKKRKAQTSPQLIVTGEHKEKNRVKRVTVGKGNGQILAHFAQKGGNTRPMR